MYRNENKSSRLVRWPQLVLLPGMLRTSMGTSGALQCVIFKFCANDVCGLQACEKVDFGRENLYASL